MSSGPEDPPTGHREDMGGRTTAAAPGSVAIGGDNYGTVTTNVTQHIRQFLLFGRRSRTGVTAMADRLAAVVRRQWSAEATQLNVHSEDRLPISWKPALDGLCASVRDSRAWVQRHDAPAVPSRKAGWVASTAALEGADLDLADVWLTRTPTRRLVVLGEAGAGKTELIIRTVVEVIGRRAEFGGVVPVIVPAAAWDGAPYPVPGSGESGEDRGFARAGRDQPGDSVELWLERWLIRNYRFLGQLAPVAGDPSYAMALLRSNRLAIVIDGFDEVPPQVRDGLLSYLRDDIHVNPQRILLLTSRPVEFTRVALAHTPAALGAATGVKLDPQPGDVVVEYLRRQAGQRSRWDTVDSAVRRGGPLAAVLETPMMALLADTVYNAAADPPDPADLTRFTSEKAIEQHLLDRYVAARYRDLRPGQLANVNRWLRFLASSLRDRPNPTDLTWWNLRPPPARHEPDGDAGRLSPRRRGILRVVAVLAAAVGWTMLSATTFNGWFYQDLELGLFAGARVTAAAVLCCLMAVLLTGSLGAGALAVAGAYIAGTVSAGYDLAIVAAIAGGFAWRPLSVRRPRWWQVLLFVAGAVTAGAVLQDDTPSPGSSTGTPWTMGFGAGFADGWSSRGDETVNGALLTALVAGLLLWTAIQATTATRRNTSAAAPVVAAALIGVVTAVLGGLTDGVRPDVTNGWLIGPADGWAAAVAVWCAATWAYARPGRGAGPAPSRGRAIRRARLAAALAGVTTIALNGLAYLGRTDIDGDWFRAAADGVGVAVVVWFVFHPDRVTPVPGDGRGRVGVWAWAVAAAVGCACLDALSAGWGRAPITGLAVGLIVAYAGIELRRPVIDGETRQGLLDTPLHAGAFVAAVTGVAAGFAYGLMLGVTFGLAVKVSRDVATRRFPARAPNLTWLGTTGGLILGAVVGVAAGFSGVPAIWLFPIAVTSGAAAAVAFGAYGESATETEVLSPRELLVQDRRTFLTAVTVIAVGLGVATGIRAAAQGGGVFVGSVAALSTIVTYGVSAGLLTAVAQSRYGAYTLWRMIYAAQGRLPWRLMTFLADAHRRGILRRNGPVYQFRHQFLQDRLTGQD
ncbi:hypothetical protein [Actinoplanes flavus]|uniref:NACHT domain-containing protein n=1 Tax=Actinoplanes flavus TaxID=2820290 RepID=A0ABS3V0B2_9ACTN|nr:hypothetical protein [Actinoplanes flavus]MBO3744278.1 hypothetical protein [Actinoplanes flavus]